MWLIHFFLKNVIQKYVVCIKYNNYFLVYLFFLSSAGKLKGYLVFNFQIGDINKNIFMSFLLEIICQFLRLMNLVKILNLETSVN